MIIKPLEKPIKITQLEASLRRIPSSRPKYNDIKDELGRKMAGYRGEQALSYYLSLLPEKSYLIFHNLRLPDISNQHYFEIDNLILSPFFILISDAKNFRGKLHLDEQFEQLIQTYDGIEKSYSCPIAQSNRHILQLTRFLQSNKFPSIPIESLVIFTNTSAIISASQNHKQIQKVIRGTSFIPRVESLEKKFKNAILDQKQINKLSKVLLKNHTPNEENVLEQYEISYENLIKGVHCPKCDTIPINRTERKWNCPSCGYSSQLAHVEAIKDYSLLVGRTITNKQLRDFLGLTSKTAATNILKSSQLPHNGGKKDRIYYFL